MKIHLLFYFSVLILGLNAQTSLATSYTWTGASTTSSNWSDKNNWEGTGYPSSPDDIALISSVNSRQPTLNVPVSIASLTIDGDVTLTLSNDLILSGALTIKSGKSLTIPVGSGHVLSVAEAATLNSSTSAFTIGAANFINFTTLTISSKCSITNSGFVAVSSDVAVKSSASSINNTSTGTFAIAGNLAIASGCSVANDGVFSVNGATTLSSSNATITNSSTGTFKTTGDIALGSGCNISNSGIFDSSSANLTTSSSNSGINNLSGGTFYLYNNSSMTFLSRCFITNAGTFYAGKSGSACVLNLNANSAVITNTGTFYLGSTSVININTNGASVSNTGTFTIQSDNKGSGAIGPITGTSPFSGTYNVERYFQGGTTYNNRWVERNYRIISSPVNTGTKVGVNCVYGLNYIVGNTAGKTTDANSTTNAFITGCAGGNTSAGNPSMYLYREDLAQNNSSFTGGNYTGITNITKSTTSGTIGASDGNTYSIPVGNGVFFYFRGAADNWAAKTTAPYAAPENVTLTSTGDLNQGSIRVNSWFLSSYASNQNLSNNGTGYSMVGNPYACTIDWNTLSTGGITLNNLSTSIYEFDPVTGTFPAYSESLGMGTGNATNLIASGQGFVVVATGANPSLVFNESAKSTGSQPTGSNLLMSTSAVQNPVKQIIRLKMITDSLNYNDLLIGFTSTGSAKYDGREDAKYIPGSSALESLSSLSSDSVQLAINALPLPKLAQQTIRLNVTAARSGQYSIQRTALNAIPPIYEVWLMDNYKKDSLDIRNNATYVFNIDLTDTATFGSNRFSLVMRQDPALGVHLLNFTATKAPGGAEVVWKTENEQNYTNFTVERSTNGGITFNTLGGFASTAQGTYGFLDKSPAAGVDQYRLKIEDLNGTVTYSSIITLMYANPNNTTAISNLSVYPNPARSTINLAINQTSDNALYNIQIVNNTGVIVKTATSAQPSWQADVSGLLPGTYVIRVLNTGTRREVGKSVFIKI